jgi:transcription termination/antitermination protein NusG
MAKKWYVIHTYSGYEAKVRDALQQRAKQFSLEDKFGEILIPSETVTENRPGGKTRVRQKLSLPGYIFVEMEMSENVWHLVKDTPKVTGFIGNQTPQEVPIPQIDTSAAALSRTRSSRARVSPSRSVKRFACSTARSRTSPARSTT